MRIWSEPSGKSESVTEEVITDDTVTDEVPADEVPAELGELDDADLTRVLEALLLVVDTPVNSETLATATEQPVYRINDALHRMARS